MAYATTNPYTGETLKTFPNATDEDVSLALNQADTAFHQWKLTSITDRVKVLKKAADLLRAKHTEYAKFLTLEMGKLLSEAEAEVELSAAIFEYYVEHAEQQLAPEKLPSKVFESQWNEKVLRLFFVNFHAFFRVCRDPI